uniref:Uncharacterized protein n=1 Tax=Lygus hesperus TaxID=30085 RepID=A0A146KSV4_LYGHE
MTTEVILWSADGVMLGTLATGRELDDLSCGKRFGLNPYTYYYDNSINNTHTNGNSSSGNSKQKQMHTSTSLPLDTDNCSADKRIESKKRLKKKKKCADKIKA